LEFVAGQVDVARTELLEYSIRPGARIDHLARVREHLGYTTSDRTASEALSAWLWERAVEHDAPSVLLALTCTDGVIIDAYHSGGGAYGHTVYPRVRGPGNQRRA
jgi:hypothetical protein